MSWQIIVQALALVFFLLAVTGFVQAGWHGPGE
jgi:hypothetical protein